MIDDQSPLDPDDCAAKHAANTSEDVPAPPAPVLPLETNSPGENGTPRRKKPGVRWTWGIVMVLVLGCTMLVLVPSTCCQAATHSDVLAIQERQSQIERAIQEQSEQSTQPEEKEHQQGR